ncbi:MAG TPA: DUF554 domain-containing protein [Dysgonomonas sp.]|nr:DUF554 domain-containing protein [Dysgonomonas sp.]
MIGTLANAGAIIIGGAVGTAIHSRLPQKMVNILFQGIGLFTLAVGISMSLKAQSLILIVVSITVGAVIGQLLDIDKSLKRAGEYLQKRFSKPTAEDGNRFSEGFVTASVLFCVGSMSILGAIEDGMGNTPNLLYTKSIMDLISAAALGASFGIAIIFSSIPLVIYQGGLTLFASFIMRYMSESMTDNLTATGGILLMGLAINILKIKEINVTNMLPALVIIVLFSYLIK